MSTPSQSPTCDRAPILSQFALSFERVAVESLLLPWHDLETIHEQMREKRKLVQEHTTAAAAHLRSISLLNAELDSLEAAFSATMAAVVSERSRSQEQLRSLVLEWEKSHIQQAAERSLELQHRHTTEVTALKQQLDAAQQELQVRQQRLDGMSSRNEELLSMMQEYGLETTGPLMESMAKRLRSPNSRRRSSLFLDPTAAANGKPSQTAPYAKLSKETDTLRGEVLRLQADLSAAKAESKVRQSEIDALRHTREEWNTLNQPLPASEDHAFYRLQSGGGGGSVRFGSSASNATSHTAAGHHQQQQVTTSMTTVSVASSSRNHHSYTQQQQRYPDTHADSPPPAVTGNGAPSISVGLDLGTRRQQQGLSGVHVVGVLEGSPAWLVGMRANDVLIGWAGHSVHRLEDISAASRSLPKGCLALDVVFVRGVGQHEELAAAAGGSGGGSSTQRTSVVSIPLEGKLNGPYNSRREPIMSL